MADSPLYFSVAEAELSFCFGSVYHSLEGGRVVEGKICKRFAIQADTFLAEQMNETAVINAHRANGCVDTGNPKTTVNALFEFAVAVGILPAFFERVLRYGVNFGAGAEETPGGQHDFLPARAAGRVVCCSWHEKDFLVRHRGC